MYKIDTEKFNQTLQLLIGYIIDAQEKDTQKKDAQKKNHCDNPTKIDFHSGWLSEQEGYKRYIWHEAQKILKCNEWLENDLSGYDITNRVLKCTNIKIETGEPQNLLDYRYKIHYKRILEEKTQEVEDLIRRIYCSPDEEQAFRQGCALFGKRYPLMAFLFFLKGEGGDSAETIRYLPVSPKNMESRFARLGIQSDCLSECTWENYQEYLCIFDDVQKRLQEQLNLDVEKIDAHSLVWATWIFDDNAYSVSETARQDAALEAEISPLREGRDRLALIKSRVNQSAFRNYLLGRYNHCCLCEVREPSLLVASHIKPWSQSNARERLDVDNGFLFCPNHDQLFDQGWITFDDSGKICLAKELCQQDRDSMHVDENMQIRLREGNKAYLAYHREKIFKG